MNPLHDEMISQALTDLGAATEPLHVSRAAAALTIGLGMERYVVIETRGALVTSVFHNAPTQLQDQFTDLQSIQADPIARRASSPIPFVWSAADSGEWRSKYGDFGYRSGVAAASWSPTGAECKVLLSSAEQEVPAQRTHDLLSFALMAAVVASGPVRAIGGRTKAPCPFTPRELDCLLCELAGMSAKQAARVLGISPRSVRQYLERARARLGVRSSYAAATAAVRHGWIDLKQAAELADSGTTSTSARKIEGL